MIVKNYVNSLYEENTYVLIIGKNALLIDPGSDKKEIEMFINKLNVNIVSILITHYHIDHTASLDYFKNKYKCNVIDYKSSRMQIINDFNFEIINTFGHTDDSVTYYFKKENIMFTGDFLFKDSIGRYDFENSSYDEMKKSITSIKKYDKNIIIYPGHGEDTTLENEILNNYYLK